MAFADILDGAFKLFRANFAALIGVTAALVVPFQLLSALALRDFYRGPSVFDIFRNPAVAASTSATPDFGRVLAAAGLVGATALIVTPLVAGGASRVVARSYLGEEAAVGDALRVIRSRWWSLVIASLVIHLAEVIGFVLCILPGLLVMALFVAVAPAIVTEDLGPFKAMRRSWRLLSPRVFRVLGIVLVAGLLASIMGGVLSFVPQLLSFTVPASWRWIPQAIGGIVTGLITQPFVAIVATLVYFDGRIRREGLDLQVMADELA